MPGPPDQFENLPAPPVLAAKPERKPIPARRTPLAVAFRHIKPDWRRYITFVDLAARKGDSAMQRVIDCYQGLAPIERIRVWPEQLCELAGVAPDELVGAVCRQIWANGAAESSMVSATAHPELLMATIKFAMKEQNFRDRELVFRMSGSLPDRKGASINIFNQATGQIAEAPDLAAGKAKLRTFDEEVIEMSRDLETPSTPFLMKADVPPEDHQRDD